MLIGDYQTYVTGYGKRMLTVNYNIENGNILSSFIRFEVICFKDDILAIFKAVLMNDVPEVDITFNFNHLLVDAENTTITNVDLDEDVHCVVSTRDLYYAILEWCEKYYEFEEQKNTDRNG